MSNPQQTKKNTKRSKPHATPGAQSDSVNAGITLRDDAQDQVEPDANISALDAVYTRNDALAKLVEGIKKVFNRIEVLIFLAIALVLTWDEANIQSALSHWDTKRAAALKKWLIENTDHALALLYAIPMVIAAPVRKRAFVTIAFAITWVLFPKIPLLVYAILFIALLIYEQLSDGGARFVVVAIVAVILVMTGHLVIEPNVNDNATVAQVRSIRARRDVQQVPKYDAENYDYQPPKDLDKPPIINYKTKEKITKQ